MLAGLQNVWVFLVVMACQTGDTYSSRAPGLTSGSWLEPGILECLLRFTTVNATAVMPYFFLFFASYTFNESL